MKTWNAKPGEVDRKWWIIDATDQTLGRLASQVATVLRGKHKVQFTPHVDTGDFVIVTNANKIKMTGNKWWQKKYYSHSRFFGSLKEATAQELLDKDSDRVIRQAIRLMLPKNRMARQVIKKLKIYQQGVHPHAAQKPEALTLKH